MIIDSHVHVVGNPASKAPDYITVKRDAVLLRRRHPDIFAAHWDRLEDMSDLLIEDMDAFGIDKAVVQPGSGESPELVAQAVAKYPDRLVGLFMSGVQAVTRVNAEQASKRTLHGPTRYPLRGRLEGLGKRARSAPPNLTSRGGVSTHFGQIDFEKSRRRFAEDPIEIETFEPGHRPRAPPPQYARQIMTIMLSIPTNNTGLAAARRRLAQRHRKPPDRPTGSRDQHANRQKSAQNGDAVAAILTTRQIVQPATASLPPSNPHRSIRPHHPA